jgi:hypothetical protein
LTAARTVKQRYKNKWRAICIWPILVEGGEEEEERHRFLSEGEDKETREIEVKKHKR